MIASAERPVRQGAPRLGSSKTPEIAGRARLGWRALRPRRDAEIHQRQVVEATSAATATWEPLFQSPSTEALLDFQAKIRWWQEVLIFATSAAICSAIYVLTAPRAFHPVYATSMAILCGLLVFLLRRLVIERQYLSLRKTEEELADSEGRFGSFDGLSLHYKCKLGNGKPTIGVHLYHGFGANLFSWQLVQGQLAQALNACVTAHDTPAFGLTPRPKNITSYGLAKSGRLGHLVLLFESSRSIRNASTTVQVPSSRPDSSSIPEGAILSSEIDERGSSVASSLETVFIGHSMGSVCAAEEVVANPGAVKFLVLVAPAIVAGASFSSQDTIEFAKEPLLADESSSDETLEAAQEADGRSRTQRHRSLPRQIAAVLAVLLNQCGRKLLRFFVYLAQPVFVLTLRMIVRSRAFWKRGLATAYYQKDFEERTITGYRLPSIVKSWEWGLVRFSRARLASGGRPIAERVQNAWKGQKDRSLVQELRDAVSKYGIKVLIIHGLNDRIIPISNSRKLYSLIPGAEFIEYPECGHVPHEEYPQKFVDDIGSLLCLA